MDITGSRGHAFLSGGLMDGLQRLVPKPKGVRKMRLYLFELEKIMKKPLHFAAVSGCAVFTFVLWWMYADQADYSMGEGAAAALLLLGCLLYTSRCV